MIMITIIQLALSISVIVNCISIFGLLKALKKNDELDLRLCLLEHRVIKLVVCEAGIDMERKNETRIPRMAEDTQVAERVVCHH